MKRSDSSILPRAIASLTLIICSFSFSTPAAWGQEIHGQIKYQTLVDLTRYTEQLADPDISLERKRKIESSIQKLKDLLEYSYVLTFNKKESLFKAEEKLGLKDEEIPSGIMDDHYKNFEDSIYVKDSDVSGRRYLITGPLPVFDWKLHAETKTIGPYTCYKATYTIDQDVTEPVFNEDGTFEEKVVRSEITTTAWYTPQIPVINGPYQYGGLPGLIMELSNDSSFAFNVSTVCTQVTLNPEKPIKIKKPKRGKVVTEVEFRTELDRMFK